MSQIFTNQESFGSDAQTYVSTGDHAPERPRDPPGSAFINPANVPDHHESDIAPAVGSHSSRAMTRRGMFMNMAVSALTGTAIAATTTATAATEAPKSIDAMLEGFDRKTKEHIFEVIMGWVNAHHDAKTGAPDPVFAAIEAHKQALDVHRKAIKPIATAIGPIDPDDEDALSEANVAERKTLLDFLLTEPTTIAGAFAALEFASSPVYPDTHDICPAPVLALAFVCGYFDLAAASADWPAMIARNIRRLIETQAWFNPGLFGPLVVKA
jgi:hypothetical protein